jgi:hypothetical protein
MRSLIARRAFLTRLSALLASPEFVGASASPHLRGRLAESTSTPGPTRLSTDDENASRIDVRNFGTRSHPYRGGGDDAVPIQAAIDRAAAIGGATVYLGPGPISFSGSLGSDHPALSWTAPGIVLKGDGPGGTVIHVKYNPRADVILLGSSAKNLNAAQSGLRNLGIGLVTGQSQTIGAAIHSSNAQKHRFHNIHTFGGFYSHFRVTGGPNQYVVWISGCLIDATAGTQNAVAIGDSDDMAPQDTIIVDLESGGNRSAGNCIRVFACSGMTINNADIINYSKNAFWISPGSKQKVVNSFIHNLQCDTCGDDGALVSIDENTGTVENINFSLCWFSSNGGAGLALYGSPGNPINGVHLSNCTAGGNVRHGIWVKSNARNIDIDNVTTAGNSAATNSFSGAPTGAVGAYSGIMIDDGNNIGVSIVGGRSGAVGAWEGFGATQKYGYAFGPHTDYCGLFGTTASGPSGLAINAIGALLNSSTGTHNRINDPIG